MLEDERGARVAGGRAVRGGAAVFGRGITVLFVAAVPPACAAQAPPTAPTADASSGSPTPRVVEPPAEPGSSAGPSPAVASSPPLSGSMGNRPFTARSALLTKVNTPTVECAGRLPIGAMCPPGDADARSVLRSQLIIFEQPVTCADDPSPMRVAGARLANDGRVVWIDLGLEHGWPVSAGMSYKAVSLSKDDHASAIFMGADGRGVDALGEVRFTEATPTSGVVVLDLKSKNAQSSTSGSIAGAIPFTVCSR